MPKYAVLESTNMGSTRYAERIFDAIYDKDIENGVIGHLEGLADGYTHIYKFVPGIVAGEPIVMVDQPVWRYEEYRITDQRKDKFVVEAGTAFRVRVLKVTDEFAISLEGFTAESHEAVEVGAFVSVDDATGKLVAAAAPVDGGAFTGEIMRKRTQGAKLITAAHTYGSAYELFTVKVNALG